MSESEGFGGSRFFIFFHFWRFFGENWPSRFPVCWSRELICHYTVDLLLMTRLKNSDPKSSPKTIRMDAFWELLGFRYPYASESLSQIISQKCLKFSTFGSHKNINFLYCFTTFSKFSKHFWNNLVFMYLCLNFAIA